MKIFKEFLSTELVKKKKSDPERAKSLIEAAERRRKFLEKYIPINEETTIQTIEECYDIIRELLEAKLCKVGYKTYSHEVVVSYLQELNFPKDKVAFLGELRTIRHGTKYYGTSIEIDYAKKVKSFMEEMYPKLKKIAEE